jgi:hypothetical protein
MLMAFGKHKGQALDQIPRGYLEWLQAEGIRKPALAAAVSEELRRRDMSDDPFGEPKAARIAEPAEYGDALREALASLERATLLVRAVIGKRERREARPSDASLPPAEPTSARSAPAPADDFHVSDEDVPF